MRLTSKRLRFANPLAAFGCALLLTATHSAFDLKEVQGLAPGQRCCAACEANTCAIARLAGACKRDGCIVSIEKTDDGKMKAHGLLCQGKREGLWTRYYRDGPMLSQYSYRAGVLHGPASSYYRSGRVLCQQEYMDGKATGLSARWTNDGNLVEIGLLAEGMREGDWYLWEEPGDQETVVTTFYINGELQDDF